MTPDELDEPVSVPWTAYAARAVLGMAIGVVMVATAVAIWLVGPELLYALEALH